MRYSREEGEREGGRDEEEGTAEVIFVFAVLFFLSTVSAHLSSARMHVQMRACTRTCLIGACAWPFLRVRVCVRACEYARTLVDFYGDVSVRAMLRIKGWVFLYGRFSLRCSCHVSACDADGVCAGDLVSGFRVRGFRCWI
jgi:hypothetical protein